MLRYANVSIIIIDTYFVKNHLSFTLKCLCLAFKSKLKTITRVTAEPSNM